ncbi:MAG: lactate utilization protein [Anaerovoracaceae bacterium]
MKKAIIDRTIENLKENGFTVKYFEDSNSAKAAILDEVTPDQTVGFGGSMTLQDMDIYEALQERGNPVYFAWKAGENESRADILKRAAVADIYLSSSNAITESGMLVNIDGTGNRLSAMLYGPDRVIIVAGVNKITRSLDEALIRIKNVAAPPNAKRIGRNTPCAKLGKCMNCDVPDRICKATLIIDRQPNAVPITIYLVGESLGY